MNKTVSKSKQSLIVSVLLLTFLFGCSNRIELSKSKTSLDIKLIKVDNITEKKNVDTRKNIISGDFNGDGYQDTAWTSKLGNARWRIVVQFDSLSDKGDELVIYDHPELPDVPLEEIELRVLPRGDYKTICSYSPDSCDDQHHSNLTIKEDAILLVVLEASSSVLIWHQNSKKFTRHWLSD